MGHPVFNLMHKSTCHNRRKINNRLYAGAGVPPHAGKCNALLKEHTHMVSIQVGDSFAGAIIMMLLPTSSQNTLHCMYLNLLMLLLHETATIYVGRSKDLRKLLLNTLRRIIYLPNL